MVVLFFSISARARARFAVAFVPSLLNLIRFVGCSYLLFLLLLLFLRFVYTYRMRAREKTKERMVNYYRPILCFFSFKFFYNFI